MRPLINVAAIQGLAEWGEAVLNCAVHVEDEAGHRIESGSGKFEIRKEGENVLVGVSGGMSDHRGALAMARMNKDWPRPKMGP